MRSATHYHTKRKVNYFNKRSTATYSVCKHDFFFNYLETINAYQNNNIMYMYICVVTGSGGVVDGWSHGSAAAL